MARKTFAFIVLLYNDVPMEIVSELTQHVRSNVVKADLPPQRSEGGGHSSIKIPREYYGKVGQKRVSEETARISRILR